ncbi:MAG TPA: hypothetical protein VJ183_13350 [Chloroflexia bacterium]|nr:hypothetical protein [Chloroflexia bacterium]
MTGALTSIRSLSQNRASPPTIGRLLISHITLRGPEIKQLHSFITATSGVAYHELAEWFVPGWRPDSAFSLEEATLREALNFLLLAGLVRQQGESRRKANFRAVALYEGAPFELKLLWAVRCQADERQQAIWLVHRQLVTRDVLAISAAELRDELERGPYARLFTWTGEKINFWSQLSSFLGLIHRPDRSPELLIAPTPSLLCQALSWALDGSPQRHSLATPLHRVNESLFSCFTERGRVHTGLSNSLIALHRLGTIRLSHSADAANSLLLGAWRVSDIELSPALPVSGGTR